jgi:protein-disulfide isomerase
MAMTFALTLAGTAVAVTKLRYQAAKHYIDGFHSDADLMRYAYEREEWHDIDLSDDSFARGPEDAPHTLVVFSDFECSHCKKLADLLAGEVQDKYGSELRVVFRHYLLHEDSGQAALAVEAAGLVGGVDGFWRMHDKLYAVQAQLRKEEWARWATEAGLDGERVVAAMKDERVVARVKQCLAQAQELGVHGTPTLFLDGRRLKVWEHIEIWEAILGEQVPAADESAAD